MEIFIVGAGAHGRVVLDILRDAGQHEFIQFADDNPRLLGQSVNGAPVAGLEETLEREPGSIGFVVALGRPSLRLALCDRIRSRRHVLFNAIHPRAVVERSVTMGTGNMIGANAVVNSNARLGDSVLVNTSVIVEHDCVVEDGVSLSSWTCLGGRVSVGRGAFLCAGALVLPRIHIGAEAVIGAGSVVMADVPEKTLVLGYPARPIKRIDESFDWPRVL
jgi:sugar O-acyltransferase (sialic acid O-acetyltransferase NeuD family)